MSDERPHPSWAGIVFNNAVITGGSFDVYGGLTGDTFNPSSQGYQRLQLEHNVAFGALLKSNERYPAPKCHPDTRKAVQKVLTDWILRKGDGWDKNILWLSGAPGVGKSAVLQTICEALAGPNSFIDASHFFGRGGGRREKAFFFPATIAYQLGLSNAWCQLVIHSKIDSNPALLRETFASQFRELVVDATKELRECSPVPITIVIDALDECDSVPDQVALLELIFEAATQHGMRFLIASRPEQDIHAFFHRDDVTAHTQHVRLDEETFNTSSDIEIFLRAQFSRIRRSRLRLYPRLANGEEWPGSAVIWQITTDSDAQFIFPHLIIDTIDADKVTSPVHQLKSILESSSNGAFSKLDSLYHQILSRYRQGGTQLQNRFKEVLLGTLEVILVWPDGVDVVDIANILDVEPHDVDNVIRGTMRSLFKFDEGVRNPCVVLCHKSLRDFLLDAKRSGEFFIASDQPYPLLYRIMSRKPPSDPTRTFLRQHLMGVIEMLLVRAVNMHLTVVNIAAALELEDDVVHNVLTGPQRSLFHAGLTHDCQDVYTLNPKLYDALETFLLDADLSGEFFISSDKPDALFLQILSRPLPSDPERTFSRQDLMGVLQVLAAFPAPVPITIPEIALFIGVDVEVVVKVACGPQRSLFDIDSETLCMTFTDDTPMRRFKDSETYPFTIVSFLRDEARSGEFHVSDGVRTPFPDYLPTPVIEYYSQIFFPFSADECMGLIRELIRPAEDPLTMDELAEALGVDYSVVRSIVYGPGIQRILFCVDEDDRVHLGDIQWQKWRESTNGNMETRLKCIDPPRFRHSAPPSASDFIY